MKTVIVTVAEIRIASERWYEFHGLKSISAWHYLKYLGEDYESYGKLTLNRHNVNVHANGIEVKEESARKIRALNGPHYKTLLAMYKAQNMIE